MDMVRPEVGSVKKSFPMIVPLPPFGTINRANNDLALFAEANTTVCVVASALT